MRKIVSVAVFCGSSIGNNPVFATTAHEVGKQLALKNYTLIYGGGCLGLMNMVSDAALSEKGKVIGIIPDFFSEEVIGSKPLSETILVPSMAARKEKIASLADAFIILPGGYGTLDELFEMLTFSQLSLHQKPIAILNLKGFYDLLLKQLDVMVKEGFMQRIHRNMLIEANNIETLFEKLENYEEPDQKDWIESIKKRSC